MQFLLILCAVCSCYYAYARNWWPYTTYGMCGGFLVASIICAPDWPFFNRNPVGWHPAIDPEKEIAHQERKKGTEKPKAKSKKHKKRKKYM